MQNAANIIDILAASASLCATIVTDIGCFANQQKKLNFSFFEKNSPYDRTPQYDISSFANQQQDFENQSPHDHQLQLRQLSLILDIDIDIGY